MSKQEVLKVVPARYPLRLIGALFSLFILAAIVQSVAGNARWEWGVFAEWFFAPAVLAGLGQTLLLTLLGTLFSILFGTLLALARLSRSYLLASLAWGYIWLFRSLPLILVLIILYNFSYLYDAISLGIPFTSVVFASYPTIIIRLVVTSGIDTAPFSLRVTQLNAPRGTGVAMVGMRASCQPMPVLIIVAPAASIAFASAVTSARVLPPLTRSSIDRR